MAVFHVHHDAVAPDGRIHLSLSVGNGSEGELPLGRRVLTNATFRAEFVYAHENIGEFQRVPGLSVLAY